MDVPFSSSGALSRRHYALVRAVESSSSIQEANNILHAEIQAVRVGMAHADLSFVEHYQCTSGMFSRFYRPNAWNTSSSSCIASMPLRLNSLPARSRLPFPMPST